MLHEVAIVQLRDGKPTGSFSIENFIAKDAEQAKIKAISQTKLAGDGYELLVKVRTF